MIMRVVVAMVIMAVAEVVRQDTAATLVVAEAAVTIRTEEDLPCLIDKCLVTNWHLVVVVAEMRTTIV